MKHIALSLIILTSCIGVTGCQNIYSRPQVIKSTNEEGVVLIDGDVGFEVCSELCRISQSVFLFKVLTDGKEDGKIVIVGPLDWVNLQEVVKDYSENGKKKFSGNAKIRIERMTYRRLGNRIFEDNILSVRVVGEIDYHP